MTLIIPIPAELDVSAHAVGDSFDVTATVRMTDKGLEVEAIDGIAVESDESSKGETEDMDETAFSNALKGVMPAP